MSTPSPVSRSAFTFAFALMCLSGLVSYFLLSCRCVTEDSEMRARAPVRPPHFLTVLVGSQISVNLLRYLRHSNKLTRLKSRASTHTKTRWDPDLCMIVHSPGLDLAMLRTLYSQTAAAPPLAPTLSAFHTAKASNTLIWFASTVPTLRDSSPASKTQSWANFVPSSTPRTQQRLGE